MPNILLVEDDEGIRDHYKARLSTAGFEVSCHANAADALDHYDRSPADLVLLDIMLGSDMEAGFTICSELRKRSATLPVIFLTSLDSDIDKISGMRLGADDYITKDISTEYLIVRLKALLNRRSTLEDAHQQKDELVCGSLRFNLTTMRVLWKNKPVNLSLTQLWIVHALVNNKGYICTTQQLMEAAKVTVQPNTFIVHIRNIRQSFIAVDPDFSAIKSERSLGYRWIADD